MKLVRAIFVNRAPFEHLDLDFNDFMAQALPIIIKYRQFKVTAYQDITDAEKGLFLELVNKFYSDYTKNFTKDRLLKYLKNYKGTLKQRGPDHLSII